MKWFEHDTNASNDPKLKKLMHKYGITGYGLYFYVLEIIARDDKNDGYLPEDYDFELMSIETKLDENIIEEILNYCVQIKLFEFNNGKYCCYKLLERADTYTKRIRSSSKSVKKCSNTSVHSTKQYKNICPTNTNTIHENKEEKSASSNEPAPPVSKKSNKQTTKKLQPKRPQSIIDEFHNQYLARYETKYKYSPKDQGNLSQIWKLADYDESVAISVIQKAFIDHFWWSDNFSVITPGTIVSNWNDILTRLNGTTKNKDSPKKAVVYAHETDLSKYPNSSGFEDMMEDIRNGKWKGS